MSMMTDRWSEAEKTDYRNLLRGVLRCYGNDEYAFFADWIAEIATREDHDAVSQQLSISRELGFLQDDVRAQNLWTAWERAGMVSRSQADRGRPDMEVGAVAKMEQGEENE